jgi:hypothetical protein
MRECCNTHPLLMLKIPPPGRISVEDRFSPITSRNDMIKSFGKLDRCLNAMKRLE